MRTFSPLPLPLWSASVGQSVIVNLDGSLSVVIRCTVTPCLPRHAVMCADGDSTHVTFAADQTPPVDGLLVGATVTITDGTGAGQASRRITEYVGATLEGRVMNAWGTIPDATSHGVLAWDSFAPFGGFFLEKALVVDAVPLPYYPVATVEGTDIVLPPDDGLYTAQFRFTPLSLAQVRNLQGRWVVTVEVEGKQGAPDAPEDV